MLPVKGSRACWKNIITTAFVSWTGIIHFPENFIRRGRIHVRPKNSHASANKYAGYRQKSASTQKEKAISGDTFRKGSKHLDFRE